VSSTLIEKKNLPTAEKYAKEGMICKDAPSPTRRLRMNNGADAKKEYMSQGTPPWGMLQARKKLRSAITRNEASDQ